MIAQEAEVDAVLVGTLLRAGDQIRVASQLVEAAGATVLWSSTIQVPVGDLFRLQDELTSRIVESLVGPAHDPRTPHAQAGCAIVTAGVRTVSPRERDEPRQPPMAGGTRSVRACCATEDPHYAPAFVGIGRMHRMIGKYVDRRNRGALRRSRRPRSGVHSSSIQICPSAESLYSHLEVDLGRAEQSMVRLLRRARERSADPEVFAGLSHALRYCGLLQASLAAVKQSRRLDPKVRVSAAHTLFMLGDYEGCPRARAQRRSRTCATSPS